MQPLTTLYGNYIDNTPLKLPPAQAAAAVRGILDCIGVMIAGRHEPAVGLLRNMVARMGTGAEVRLQFEPVRVSTGDAALINGTAAHALDFDDIGAGLRGHPSTVLVPALLAEAEASGLGGAAVVDAYLTGYQIWGDLVRREEGHHHLKGFHPTGILGAVAAGAACARLLRLDRVRAASAVGIAASQAAGLLSNFGSMTKPFHAGRSAQAGVVAARLAEAGFTASADALEHERGFLRAFSPQGRVDIDSPPEVETRWFIDMGINVKQYPVCYGAHRVIDTVRRMRGELSDRLNDIEGIEVLLSATHAGMLRSRGAQTALEAKFSVEFAVAASLIAGDVSLLEVTDGFVARPDVQALMSRVGVQTTDEELPDLPGYAPHDRVTFRLRDGAVLAAESHRLPEGHGQNPIGDAALDQKFLACCAHGGWESGRAGRLLADLRNLENIASIREIGT